MSEITKLAITQFAEELEKWDEEPKSLMLVAFSDYEAVDSIDFGDANGEMFYKAYRFKPE